ncbi:hypothetical protein INT47_012709 [Mucor saturninus]|uniref:Methyltransferase domain-containing protein n=1 Tax=Mucor saturninus TaxID=64648 RepID=A0A8H7R612_9FUNG|nr:hypothetical protein INT47_012709 [Mucor saturninus]
MGNNQSQPKKNSKRTFYDNVLHASTTNHSMPTPPMSTKSSPNSRPASLVDDVKSGVHKMLHKTPSKLDETTMADTYSLNSCQTKGSKSADHQSRDKCTTEDALINGRTYQTLNNKYCLPIDDEEQDRLTNTHYVLKQCFGDNFTAPIHDLLSRSVSVSRDSSSNLPLEQQCKHSNSDNSILSVSPSSSRTNLNNGPVTPARVLDVACGSGVWVLDMASSYPDSQFYGIDFACIFPNTIKPPNTTFHQGDLLDPEGFPYPDEFFDYIHMRLVYNCFSPADLKTVLNEINRVLKPGGYVEFRDIDPTIKNPGPTADQFFADFTDRMLELHSVDVTWTQRLCEVLSNLGDLTDIHHQEVSVGFGYDGPLASSIDCSIRDALRSHKQFFMNAYSITSDECEEKINNIIKESATHHSYFNYYMAWGRKPLVMNQLRSSGQNTPATPTTPVSADFMHSYHVNIHDSPELLASVLTENAFDIVHFANGFIE